MVHCRSRAKPPCLHLSSYCLAECTDSCADLRANCGDENGPYAELACAKKEESEEEDPRLAIGKRECISESGEAYEESWSDGSGVKGIGEGEGRGEIGMARENGDTSWMNGDGWVSYAYWPFVIRMRD